MKKYLLVFVLTLAGCQAAPTPFIDVTTTPTPPPLTLFTARIDLSSPNGDTVSVYAESVEQVFTDGRPSMSFFGITCAVISSGESGKCYGEDTKLLLDTLPIKSIKSSCWTATKQGQDYTEPQPCQQ